MLRIKLIFYDVIEQAVVHHYSACVGLFLCFIWKRHVLPHSSRVTCFSTSVLGDIVEQRVGVAV